MRGLMMPFQLTLTALVHRAELHFGDREILSELPDHSWHRLSYAYILRRARRLAAALQKIGLKPGDRVATLCWNHHRHLECYLGITANGFVLHTLNLRLHPDDLTYIVQHADDRVLLVDEVLLPLFEKFRDRIPGRQVIVLRDPNSPLHLRPGDLDYEAALGSANDAGFSYPQLHEDDAAALCYTSGTTGRPKGVLYSHRALTLHTMTFAMTDTAGVGQADVILPVVPMFHANCWGIPFVAAMTGAKLILTGPHFDLPKLLELLERERVTLTAGVPTIWLGLLQHLDRDPGSRRLSEHLRTILVGGSAVPRGMIQGYQERHGLKIVQLWGMTELSPLGTMCHLPATLESASPEAQYQYRARQGVPLPFVEIRGRGVQGLIPWDGETVGELEVRGPWVVEAYYNSPEGKSSFTDDGWLRTGDIVSIDSTGCIQVQDRAKDLIKSGGEWISSVALENALMGHPAVAEAAVVAVAHPKWQERPLACVVLKQDCQATAEELLAYLENQFAKWWLPDAVVFIPEIPRTSAGKFLKKALRESYHDYLMQREPTG